jgi:carboxynorspermidine decarboxylase
MIDTKNITSPCYVVEERLLRRNLALIQSVAQRADVEIILAFKAFALWKTFPIIREYITKSTASSLSEAYLAFEEMGSKAHTYSPVYQADEFDKIASMSSHITFNSLAQAAKFAKKCEEHNVSCGLRINPEFSEVETALYNPCSPGSRLGVTADLLGDRLPKNIEGLHFHTLCESTSYDLENTLKAVENRFAKYFSQIKWINFGGGHLMTHKDYDVEHLIKILAEFKQRYPHLQVILEPGSAFAWQTGFLLATVEDIVENQGIKTAILNISFACHLPDCLEMPYKPAVRGEVGAQVENLRQQEGEVGAGYALPLLPLHKYRFGGNSCLSGDFLGDFYFSEPLQAGQQLIFEDMIHYTTVKTTMFNGVSHPSIGILKTDGNFELYRQFSYFDYKNRMN